MEELVLLVLLIAEDEVDRLDPATPFPCRRSSPGSSVNGSYALAGLIGTCSL